MKKVGEIFALILKKEQKKKKKKDKTDFLSLILWVIWKPSVQFGFWFVDVREMNGKEHGLCNCEPVTQN